jgi:hypothetical protein
MERFFSLQPLIEAVTADFAGFRGRLAALPGDHAAIQEALRTRILAQRLAPDGPSLLGEPRLVIENDQPWEAHLIEGRLDHPARGALAPVLCGQRLLDARLRDRGGRGGRSARPLSQGLPAR